MGKDIRKYIKDDSHIWSCLQRYNNTTMNLMTIDPLIRDIWHEKINKKRPADWAYNPKYKDQMNFCLKEIEDYISEKIGFNVKIRYVKSNKIPFDTVGFLCGKRKVILDPLYKDFWVIERVREH